MSGVDYEGPVDPLRQPRRRRILALSGGGYRGLFTARVLANLEMDAGRRARELFDLVIGTSAGALVAAGVANGVPATDVAAAFQAHGTRIFPRRAMGTARRFFHRAPYDAAPLAAAIEAILGDDARRRMSTLKANLAITAVSQTHASFRLYAAGQYAAASDGDMPLVEAILASAAAPTYFPPRRSNAETLVDGGVVANAPEIAGIGLVKRVQGTPLERIEILSVGTASPATGNLPMAARPYSIVEWMMPSRNLLFLTLYAQEDLARRLAGELLGERYCRIDAAPSGAQAKVMGGLDQAGAAASQALFALADAAWQKEKRAVLDLVAG